MGRLNCIPTKVLEQNRRFYSKEFKQQLVTEFESGKFSVAQLHRLYGVSSVSIYNWIYKLSTFNEKGIRIVEMKQSSSTKLKPLEQKVKTLEQIVGQKQIQIDYLDKMIELAKEEYKIDLKKTQTPNHQLVQKTPRTNELFTK